MSELRFDPIHQEWVTVAAKRMQRPVTDAASACPFCPAEDEAHSEVPRSDYDVAVFDNQFPSFGGVGGTGADPLPEHGCTGYRRARGFGTAEVVVYSPRHETDLGTLSFASLRLLVDAWADRTEVLFRRSDVACVFVFENRGASIGQTIDHPHGQIYGYPFVPTRIRLEYEAVWQYRRTEGSCLFCDLLARDEADGRRLVDQAPGWRVVVPFAPRFPFELQLVPTMHRGRLGALTATERDGLASLLGRTVRRYDRLWGKRMEYMMCIDQAPRACQPGNLWHLHLAFYPLRRSADKLKYLAGSESGAGAFLLDAAPEEMAQRLVEAGE